jgi:hypothetical protein
VQRLLPVRIGVVFALAALLYGFGLGIVFGVAEDAIKEHLKAGAEAALATAYDGDAAKAKKVCDKSWVYFKRAHLHANGLGTSALALILLLSLLPAAARLRAFAAAASGIGALGYALFWMLAGLRAPGLGSTGAAKESLTWLAMPTAGLCLIGLLLTLGLTVHALFIKSAATDGV